MTNASDRLLSEVERQRKYLGRLPEDFAFPLFNARQALESQRASGYRNTAAASREIVDNSFEAGASTVHVVFDGAKNKVGQKVANSVAFIDDGAGMLPEMARYALSWGGGTHFDDPNQIGKFGFGLPNSSINQTRRVEVYSRLSADDRFSFTYLDIGKFSKFGIQEIPAAKPAELPRFVRSYLDRTGLAIDHGTVVVWANPDRLSYRRTASLKEHLLDDFGATYRYMLRNSERSDGIEIVVEGTKVDPVDPLFLQPAGRFYLDEELGGAKLVEERFLPVVFRKDPDSGERQLTLVEGEEELEEGDDGLIAAGMINVRIARLQPGFAEQNPKGDEEAKKRFEIRKSRRGMSFVRAGRELQTLESFPRSARDVASGLGRWPLLQSYAYHWGIEVRFEPQLDEAFGITNDKQAVRPSEDFWRILTEAEIDAAARRENNWQREQRRRTPTPPQPDRPSAAERAAHDADVARGTRPQVPEIFRKGARAALEQAASDRARTTAASLKEAREALELESQRRPYRIEYVEAAHAPFFQPRWVGSQIVVSINKEHPFFDTLYGELLKLSGGARAKEGVDLLLIALAKAELQSEDDDLALWYEAQRKQTWSPFLETAMKSLGQKLETPEEDAETGFREG